MSLSPLLSLARVMTMLFGLAVIASGINSMRTEWAADHAPITSGDAPTPPAIQTDLSQLSPAARADAIKAQIAMLQRELDASKREQAQRARTREARGNAQGFLQISVALMVVSLAAMLFLQRRVAAAAPAAPQPRDL